MADEQPARRWSRSEETIATLAVAGMVGRFLDESLTAEGLSTLLDDVAKVLQISNWHDVCKSPLLAAMRKAGDHAIWVDKSSGWLPKGDKGLTAAESWWALKDARAAVLGMMATVQANVAAGKPGLRGLAKDSLLLQLLAKAGQLRTGEPWFTRDLVVWPVELTEELVDGVKLYPLDAVVAGLLKQGMAVRMVSEGVDVPRLAVMPFLLDHVVHLVAQQVDAFVPDQQRIGDRQPFASFVLAEHEHWRLRRQAQRCAGLHEPGQQQRRIEIESRRGVRHFVVFRAELRQQARTHRAENPQVHVCLVAEHVAQPVAENVERTVMRPALRLPGVAADHDGVVPQFIDGIGERTIEHRIAFDEDDFSLRIARPDARRSQDFGPFAILLDKGAPIEGAKLRVAHGCSVPKVAE